MTVLLLSVITLTSKLMGFVREQIVASSFGVSAVSDALVSAQMLPIMLEAIVGASVATVVVPLVTAARRRTPDALAKVVYSFTLFTVMLYMFVAILVWSTAPALMRTLVSGFDDSTMAQAVELARLLAPSVMLLGASSFVTALLNVHGRFVLASAATLSANFAIALAAYFYRSDITVRQLAWAIIIGYVAQLAILVANLLTARIPFVNYEIDWAPIRQGALLALPLMMANGIGQLTPIVDKLFASHMAEGSIATLNYAIKLVQLPQGVVVAGLASVLFTRFSDLSARGDDDALTRELGSSLRLLIFVMLPATGLLMALATPLVSVAFHRGNFDLRAVDATAGALRIYAVGLLPLTSLPVLTRVLHSWKDTKTHLAAGAAGTAAYVAAALVMGPFFAHLGLAIAFVVGQYTFLAVTCFAVARGLGPRVLWTAASALPVDVIATGLAVVSAHLIAGVFVSPLSQLLSSGTVAACMYFGVHVLCRSEEIDWIKGRMATLTHRLQARSRQRALDRSNK